MRLEVGVEVNGRILNAGWLFHDFQRGKEFSTFEYSAGYLSDKHSYNLSPEFELYSGAQPSFFALPASFSDSAPDRWGRNLIAKKIRADEPLRKISELDYLLGVSDESRIGAMRFSDPINAQAGQSEQIPPLIELPRLLAASRLQESGDFAAVKELLGAGSASLGGARPKAQIRDLGDLWIAKFPHQSDEWDVMAFEKLALDLAASYGITTPESRLVNLDGKSVLLSRRFDRKNNSRIGYQSFMTALLKSDGGTADYLELAEHISRVGTGVTRDLRQLYLRLALSIAIRNTDDHLRNHALLRNPQGWDLSPAFDINPNPFMQTELRATTIAGASGAEAEFNALIDNAQYFDMDRSKALGLLRELPLVLDLASQICVELGISKAEFEPFREVFENNRRLILNL